MSAWDVPLSLMAIGAGVGAFVGFGLFVAVCLIVERRGRK